MAMEFDDQQLDEVFGQVFKPAARRAGFNLVKLTEQPRAGLIDVRLRAELRRARFVVADLTTDNLGAYWEAGFAEGLGRPVIYTCRLDQFENARTHFDVNHSLTIKWDPQRLAVAGQELTDTIRATLPAEAILSDPSTEDPSSAE